MFGFGKKKVESSLYSPVNGKLIDIEKVDDPVFSTKVMGQGFAVIPKSDEIVSPVEGKVTMVAKTKHAIGITMDNELEILIHMGLETVDMKGAPFELFASVGKKIKHGEAIATMNREMIKEAGLSDAVMVIITNSADKAVDEIKMDDRNVSAGEKVISM